MQAFEPCNVASELSEATNFMQHNIAVSLFLLQRTFGKPMLHEFVKAVQTLALSTAFSGHGCPEQAHYQDVQALSWALCEHFPGVKHYYAIEYESECQYELLMSPGAPDCLYSDIAQGMNDWTRAKVEANIGTLTFDDLSRIFKHPGVNK